MQINTSIIFDTEEVKKEVFGEKQKDGYGCALKIEHLITSNRRLANLKGLIGELPEPNEFIFIEQVNYFNGISFIQLLVEKFKYIDQLWVCTYNLNNAGILYFANSQHFIGRVDLVVNEQFRCEEPRFLPITMRIGKQLGFHYTKNHKKVIIARIGDSTYCMEGSANVTGVAKHEQCIIYNHDLVAEFRKSEIEKQILCQK